jgi:serine/threonine-protein kinase
LHEISLLKSIHHPGLPSFIAEGTAGKIPFYIMEYVEGKTFEQIIFQEGKSYSEIECFSIAAELLEILDYLHQKKIIHRDVRIPNIMMEDKRIKVIDLGLAKRTEQEEKGRKQKSRHPLKQVNVQSDYYGLGHFLLFLLYSSYTPKKDQKERSWEEELVLSDRARIIIRKLLQIDLPYENGCEIKQDFQRLLKKSQVKGDGDVVL